MHPSPFAENAQGKHCSDPSDSLTARAPLICDALAERAGSLALDIPKLHPEEHAWIEELTGRTLTNEEAQTLLREAKLTASWESIYGKRG